MLGSDTMTGYCIACNEKRKNNSLIHISLLLFRVVVCGLVVITIKIEYSGFQSSVESN